MENPHYTNTSGWSLSCQNALLGRLVGSVPEHWVLGPWLVFIMSAAEGKFGWYLFVVWELAWMVPSLLQPHWPSLSTSSFISMSWYPSTHVIWMGHSGSFSRNSWVEVVNRVKSCCEGWAFVCEILSIADELSDMMQVWCMICNKGKVQRNMM